jgi:hypothetical protein
LGVGTVVLHADTPSTADVECDSTAERRVTHRSIGYVSLKTYNRAGGPPGHRDRTTVDQGRPERTVPTGNREYKQVFILKTRIYRLVILIAARPAEAAAPPVREPVL